ncbi:MAG: SpoVR family protein [Salinarchaeum sp.]
MSSFDRYRARREADRLESPVREARNLAERLGLDPYPVNYWIVDYDEMNELIAYEGFQDRYPHWRWGMKYDRQRKQDQYLGGKAFEIVNNDNPAHAFLQESNTLADQKAVITHVEAHSDFFANNEWFGLFPKGEDGAAAMLERHARRIREIMSDPEIDRSAVERWMDNVLSIADTIDQHSVFTRAIETDEETDKELPDDEQALLDRLEELDVDETIREAVFEETEDSEETATEEAGPHEDVLAYLHDHGKQFDPETERAAEYEDWQREILEILRTEAYYFAGQRMTKVMNEGWASYHESIMMTGENFADDKEFLTYADHMSKVLGSGGLNPYSLGLALWEYVENRANRREVIERLLRVEGITWRNLTDAVDFDRVRDLLAPPAALADVTLDGVADLPDRYVDRDAIEQARAGAIDVEAYPWKVLSYEGLARRHYSLVKPQHRGVLERIGREELERIGRYLFDDDRYDTIEAAIADIEYTVGWDRMREVRASHNDVTFLDAFLTQEFIEQKGYFTYEYSQANEDYRVASNDPGDVKRKLLLEFTNFGKPTIVVEDGNYNNRNELLLAHQYNGIELDHDQAKRVLERVFELWGRPVNLKTIRKEVTERDLEVARRRDSEPEPDEQGLLLRYDGAEVSEESLEWAAVEHLAADAVDYDTTPDDWL